MNLITIDKLSKAYGTKRLFNEIDMSIHSGDKIGLIGRNGEGKTTLLKIIAGAEEKDSGNITTAKDINIEYLPQNVFFEDEATVIEQVFRGNSSNIKLVRRYQEAISKEDIDNDLIMKLSMEMDKENAWELESEAKTILTQLGINDFNKKIGTMSGGQKRRVALASALINPADVLILDEPTNHLDNDTIEWLEEYLKNKKGALLMVTHDRYFLDRVTNKILELENEKIYEYEGNYNYFVEKKVERQERDLASERKRKSLYRQELAWMRQGVKARGTRQKARVERFEDLKESKINIDNANVDISVAGHRLGRKIIEVENVSKSFGDKEILKNFTYTVLRNDRIGILGDNGAGKSTLMNIITGRLEPDSGVVDVGETVKIGYFSQESQDMDIKLRAIEYIKEGGEYISTSDGSKITASQMMERFLFTGDEQWTPIEKLSGGERRRLYLLRVLMEGPNLLILDEPTNDLDINTLNILEDYIDEFMGPVIIVSHDRYMLDKSVDKVFFIENALVKEYTGNYSYFKEKQREERLIEEKELENTQVVEVKESKSISRSRTLKFTFNEQREWDTIHDEIAMIEENILNLEKKMKEFATNYVELQKIMDKKAEEELELEKKMERWMYLSELKEEIDNQN